MIIKYSNLLYKIQLLPIHHLSSFYDLQDHIWIITILPPVIRSQALETNVIYSSRRSKQELSCFVK